MFLLSCKTQVEPDIVVADHIQQVREAPIVIEAAFVRRLHEPTVFSHEQSCQIHCFIRMIRCSVCLETIDSNVAWLVQVPAWFSPKWLDMTIIATGLAAEQLIATSGGGFVKIDASLWRRRGYRQLIKMERRQEFGD